MRAARQLLEPFLDLVYPPHCLLCNGWSAEPLCDDCIAAIDPVPKPICPRCGQTLAYSGAGPACPHCAARTPAFDRARSLGAYDGILRRAIHRMKYRDRPQLAGPLGCALAAYARTHARSLGGTWDLIVAVPMTPARERVRGYNQADRVSRVVAADLGIAFEAAAIRRVKSTQAQVGLSSKARQENLAGAFSADREQVVGKTILLIDDVATTGSTLHECATALKAAGASKVYALTLAAG
jgi:ComF family protein